LTPFIANWKAMVVNGDEQIRIQNNTRLIA
jgi:hypothetical protein